MKKLKPISVSFILLLSFLNCYSQNVLFDWAQKIEYNYHSLYSDTKIDNFGNIHVCGGFKDSIKLSSTNPNNIMYSNIFYDGYIAKFDSNGTLLWQKQFGGQNDDHVTNIALDKNKNIYAVGFCHDSVNFGTTTTPYYPNDSMNYFFITKLDSNGNLLWVRTISGQSPSYFSNGIVIDDSLNLIITGTFANSTDFDPGLGVHLMSQGAYNAKSFILKLDSVGNFKWVKRIGGYFSEIKLGFQNEIILGGTFANQTNLAPWPSPSYIPSSTHSAFITKLTANGDYRWSKLITPTYYNIFLHGLALDSKYSIYSTGQFRGTVDFDPDSIATNNITTPSNPSILYARSAYFHKLDSSGNFIWARYINASYGGFGIDLSIDSLDNIYGVGNFTGSAKIVSTNDTLTLSTGGGFNSTAYITRFDTSGNFKWAKTFKGVTANMGIRNIGLDFNHNIYMRGSFEDSCDFDPGLGNYYMNSPGNRIDFLFKMKPCTPKYNTSVVLSCGSYLSPSGKYLWQTTGTYLDTIIDQHACDTFLTVKLHVENMDTSITIQGIKLISNSQLTSYQWMNCDSNYGIINGQNNQSFTVTQNGNYAVIISKNGCTDTSRCVSMNSLGIHSVPANDIILFPNPSNGNVFINFKKVYPSVKVLLTDQTGRLISFKNYTGQSQIMMNLSNNPPGIYQIQIQDNNGNRSYFKVTLL